MGAQNMCGAMMSILQPQPPPSPFSPPLGLLIICVHLSQLVFQGLKQDNYSCCLTDCEGKGRRKRRRGGREDGRRRREGRRKRGGREEEEGRMVNSGWGMLEDHVTSLHVITTPM